MDKTLDDLEVGDYVKESGRLGYAKCKVGRITKTQIVLDNTLRYRKDSGRRVGGSVWEVSHIIPWTDTDEVMHQENLRLRKVQELLTKVANIKPKNLSQEHVDMLNGICDDVLNG